MLVNDINGLLPINSALKSMGKIAMNALYPNEFEYYLMSFELMDLTDFSIVDELTFPVMPTSFMENKQNIVNVRKTSTAVVSLFNKTHNPIPISVSGTFGRNSRILLGRKQAHQKQQQETGLNKLKEFGNQYNDVVKNGFGVLKILESIFKKSQQSNSNSIPYILFFYNHALNNHYAVEVIDWSFQQSMENNMLWNYSFDLKTLCLAEDIDLRSTKEKNKQLIKRMSFSVLNNEINKTLSQVRGINKQINYKTALNFAK